MSGEIIYVRDWSGNEGMWLGSHFGLRLWKWYFEWGGFASNLHSRSQINCMFRPHSLCQLLAHTAELFCLFDFCCKKLLANPHPHTTPIQFNNT